MARPREFDTDQALQAALELFWQRGYEATSISDLVEHLGIGRASIYAAFGNKHELYLKALDRYLKIRDPDPIALLSQPGPALPAISALFERYTEETICDQKRRGCMVVNAAVERLPGDLQVARRIESSWDSLEVALTSALTRAAAQGELSAEREPRAVARFLLIVLQGLRVIGKGDPDPNRLRDATRQALSILN
jgi:TetR/AcrR family transcriptional repressor of nem operon